jgi:hypothetical protein
MSKNAHAEKSQLGFQEIKKESKKELIARLLAKGPGTTGRCCGRCHF